MSIAPTLRVDIFMAGDIAVAKQVCREFCFNVGLCVHIHAADYIYTGGEEAGFKVGLVNYPRFPTDIDSLLKKAHALTALLQVRLCQRSALVVGPGLSEWLSVAPPCEAVK